MKKHLILFLLCLAFFTVELLQAQTAPSGYTTNFRFRKWAQGANPGADSLNANWTDIDAQIKARGWSWFGAGNLYPFDTTITKIHIRTKKSDTTQTSLLNVYGKLWVQDTVFSNNINIGSASTSAVLTESYNAIIAPAPGVVANIVSGIKAINNTAATGSAWNNSPAIQLKQFSWNPTALASQENSWYLHNWGFSTSGDAGGVLVFTNKRPSGPNTYSTFAIDELGRTVIGYNKSHGSNYYGFWGEDFGGWGVILAHSLPVVVGWPENSVTTNFRVTGTSTLDGNVAVGITAASAKTHIVSTADQLRIGWGAGQYLNFSTDANGLTTLSGAGSAPGISTALNITAGDVAVNGGDLTTNQATFNLINANATTLNIGGAATSATLFASGNRFVADQINGRPRFTWGTSAGTGISGRMYLPDSVYSLTTLWMDANRNLSNIGTISSGGITTSQSLIINVANDHAVVDAKTTGSTSNIGLSTWRSGLTQWFIGNRGSSANFSFFSYSTGTDVFVINWTSGAITTGTWNGSAISDTYLSTISTAGKVSGSAITSGTVAGTTAWNTSGDITSTGATSLSKSTAGTPTLNLTNDANSATERALRIFSQGGEKAYWASNGDIFIKIPRFNGTNTTGAGTALLGTNSPATALSAPYTWIQVTTSDGSTGYVPVWK